MLVAVILVLLLCQCPSSAESDKVKYRCSDNSNNNNTMTFSPSLDRVDGRYTAELCTEKNPNWVDWKIDLTYYVNPRNCSSSLRGLPGKPHSNNIIEINDPSNCTHVCYAMNFDLIFSSCYRIQSTLIMKSKNSHTLHDSYYMINNNFTKDYFNNNRPHVNFVNHDEEVSLHWYLGIPVTDFIVDMCHILNTTMECVNHEDVSRNCSQYALREVRCKLAPPHGHYSATLELLAPWAYGAFNSQRYVFHDFWHRAKPEQVVRVGSARVWWACGGVLLGAGALLAAAAVRRALRTRAYHKQVLDAWRRSRGVEAPPPVEPGGRPVLLLYAREGEHGQRAVAALKALIQKATGGLVYDLFSPEVMALSASAPASWVRGMLARDDVRVLLVQSPAMAALYDLHLCEKDTGLRLREPLLGRRAMYRAPQFGDQLLQLALRLVAETAATHHAYYKYYIATYSELETEILQQVVPYRRYQLPGAASVLTADLAGAAPEPELLQELSRTARELVTHVRDNPDYLMDELIIF